MIAWNKITHEEIKDLDPSNENDLYYSLDKRIWDFIEEFNETSKPVIEVRTIDGDYIMIPRKKLNNVYISTSEHLIYK